MISNSEVAHNFATGIFSGKQSPNMFWEKDWNGDGRTVYSYGHHFAICRIEGNIAYFTTRTYSNTTAKHCNEVRSAVSHFKIVKCYNPDGSTATNFEAWSDSINAELKELAYARNTEARLANIARYVSQAEAYADAKGVKLPREIAYFKTFKTTAPKIAKVIKEGKKEHTAYLERTREARRQHAEFLAQRRAEKEAREARWREEENRRKEESRKTYAERLEKFNNGENVSFAYYELSENVPMRIQDKKGYKIVYTAKGVSIPMNAAKEFAQRVKDGIITVGEKLEYYTVGKISDESVAIGCHNFKADYLKQFAEIVLNA